MINTFSDRPLIIIGMHRSGTSVLSKMLCDFGLFGGNDQTKKNHESYFFYQINQWLFRQCGVKWDHPEYVRELFSSEQVYECCKQHVREVISSPYSASYLGSVVKGGLFSVERPWGWKDPRNTFTLPLWLDLFPKARVLNLVRNGVDVANSLKVREDAHFKKKVDLVERKKMLRKRSIFNAKLKHEDMRKLSVSLRCLNLEGGLSLWEEYVEEGHSHVQKMGDRGLNVCYEELLTTPEEVIREVCAFVGLSPTEAEVSAATAGLNPARACAYLNDPVLKKFAEENHEKLTQW